MYVYHTFNDQFFFIELLGLFKSFGDVAIVKVRIASAFLPQWMKFQIAFHDTIKVRFQI